MNDKIYLWHPMKGKRPFSAEHAERLFKIEEQTPSGWEKYNGQDLSTDAEENTNLTSEHGADKRSNSGSNKRKKKQSGTSRSKDS